MISDESDSDSSGTFDEDKRDKDRVSVALLGIREEVNTVIKNYSDIYITQIHRNNLLVAIPFGFHHVVLYNSMNLRILPLRREVKAIMPRTEYKRIEYQLQGLRIGEILAYRNMLFVCVDKSAQSRYNVDRAIKGMESAIIRGRRHFAIQEEDNFNIYYLSNGDHRWKTNVFSSLAHRNKGFLHNYILSTSPDNYFASVDKVDTSSHKKQKKREPHARGECWPATIYTGEAEALLLTDPKRGDPPEGFVSRDQYEALQREVAMLRKAERPINPSNLSEPGPSNVDLPQPCKKGEELKKRKKQMDQKEIPEGSAKVAPTKPSKKGDEKKIKYHQKIKDKQEAEGKRAMQPKESEPLEVGKQQEGSNDDDIKKIDLTNTDDEDYVPFSDDYIFEQMRAEGHLDIHPRVETVEVTLSEALLSSTDSGESQSEECNWKKKLPPVVEILNVENVFETAKRKHESPPPTPDFDDESPPSPELISLSRKKLRIVADPPMPPSTPNSPPPSPSIIQSPLEGREKSPDVEGQREVEPHSIPEEGPIPEKSTSPLVVMQGTAQCAMEEGNGGGTSTLLSGKPRQYHSPHKCGQKLILGPIIPSPSPVALRTRAKVRGRETARTAMHLSGQGQRWICSECGESHARNDPRCSHFIHTLRK